LTRADTVVAAVVARPEALIRTDLQLANTVLERSEQQRPEAQAAVSTARARLEIRKKEIELVEKQIELAKKEKNDADRARYERDKAALERRKRLVETEIELAEAQVQLTEGRRDLARAEIQALERELELGIAQASLSESVQRKLLEALDRVGTRREELGKREKRLVEKQVKVLDAAREVAAY
jgi:hypothetical protein